MARSTQRPPILEASGLPQNMAPMSGSFRVYIHELTSTIERLRQEISELKARNCKLEEQVNRNSTNSNRPPSSDSPFKKSDEGSKKKSKKKEEEKKPRPYHKGASKPVLSPTEIHDCHPEVCPHCGGKEFKKVKQTYSSQHIEITAAPVIVVEDQVYKGKCSQCGHTVSGTVPEEHVQRFGPRISAFIAYLDSLGVTRRQIQEILQDVLGIPISQGGIQKVIDRASEQSSLTTNSLRKGCVIVRLITATRQVGVRMVKWARICTGCGYLAISFWSSSWFKFIGTEKPF